MSTPKREKSPLCLADAAMRKNCCENGDSHVFLDEIGLTIPVWRVQEAHRNLPNVSAPRNPWYRYRGSKRYDGNGGQFRNPRTQQERREARVLDGEGEVRIKLRRRRLGLPTRWDAIQFAARKDRSWKRFRKTRWRST